ncbi:hypothetical protein A2671_00745 [Candidatus Kaiserbacteria bacterium RIFCSPHIGHO2_01_FULL_49_13]|uniref:Methionine--tRNA ligase n=1 Tax=Candidatus Kaiserbacteria bacterium RIFCSPHIGHO2_01_FULL_49_13 TaxID=1798477 RepID=A0A1F6CES3_9BACT|nr:MAG: hypothetical protein A2671_00745 [Candidatus Kaiserbacteria bacterium RIFCSPHIGHO2_01_FULL_49_13]
MNYATIDDFQKLELRIGTILSAEAIPDSDKLLKLMVDFGEEAPRQILAGIKTHIADPTSLIGTQCGFVANMAPRKLRGLESNGMLLAASTEDGTFSLLKPEKILPPGTRIK